MPYRLIDAEVAAAASAVDAALAAHQDPQSTATAAEVDGMRAGVASARAGLEANRQSLIDNYRLIAQLRAQIAAARDAGDAAAIAWLEAQLATALADRATLAGVLLGSDETLRDAHSDAVTDMGTAAAYVHLDPETPIALLPVRLETRYFAHDADHFSLWVRIYPDEIHIDDDQPLISADEDAAAREYWQARLAEGPQSDDALAAWQTLCSRFGAGRAARLAGALDPFGRDGAFQQGDDGAGAPPLPTPALAPDGWADPARARALPDRFTIAGYRGDDRVLLAFTGPVRPDLRVSPEVGAPGEELADAAGAGGADAGIEWLTDFAQAEEAGMAARITVRKTIARSMERLVAFGVRASETPADSAATLAALLSSHAADDLHFVPQLAPTNNTDSARSAYRDRDRDHRASHARLLDNTASSHPQAYQDRTASALGVGGGVFRHARHARDLRERSVQAMHSALWPTTFGALLRDHVEVTEHPANTDFVRGVFVDRVRPAGALPCLRVGAQPYGLLPVVALERWRSQAGGATADREKILVNLLRSMRLVWRGKIPGVPRLFDALDPQRALIEALSLAPTGEVLDSRYCYWQPVEKALEMQQRMTGWWDAVLPRLVQGTVDLYASHGGARLLDRQSFGRGARSQTSALPSPTPPRPPPPPPPLVYYQADKSATLEQNYIAALAGHPSPSQVTGFDVAGAADQPVLYRLLGGAYLDNLYNQFGPYYAHFFAALQKLEDLDVETLEALCAGAIDSATHRLDAWVGAVAGLRLDEARSARPAGVHLGAFGLTEGLEPPGEPPVPGAPVTDDPDSAGYLHLPSSRQAKTAAILHGGHLAHADQAAAQTLSMQLDSGGVRLARWLLEGMREGLTLGALLGYRLERLMLAAGQGESIRELRLAVPLRTGEDAQPGVEAAALNVVDGLQALRLPQGELAAAIDAVTDPAAGTAIAAAIQPSLDAVARALDAVSDLLLAEGVHHAAGGNPYRAGAAFDALAEGGGAVPEVEVTATPRPGQALEHRLMVLLPQAATAGWPGDGTRLRAEAEPRLNAWAAALLDDPARIRFIATYTGAGGTVIVRSHTLAELDLCALDLVCLAAADFETAPLVAAIGFFLTLTGPTGQGGFEGTVEIGGRDPGAGPGDRQLDEAVALAHELARVLDAGRPLDASHLTTAGSADGVIASELDQRASAVDSRFQSIAAAFTADPAASANWWRAALITGPVDPAGSQASAAVLADLGQRAARHQAVDAGISAAAAARDQIAALLGQDFPLLPTFEVANPGPVDAGFADQATLLDGDATRLKRWLEDYARVRPPCEALDLTLTLADLAGAPAGLQAAQLPYMPGRPWIGEQLAESGAAPRLSLVAHAPFAMTLAQGALAGVLVDAWSEVVPGATAVTGLAFHYDAPKARAPQAILLAVPPDPGRPWDFEDLEATLLETLELAKLRGVEARDLPGQGRYLPAVFLIQDMEQEPPPDPET